MNMNKKRRIIIGIILVIIFFSIYKFIGMVISENKTPEIQSPKNIEISNLAKKDVCKFLSDTKEIKLKPMHFSFKKKYEVYASDVKIGTIEGKFNTSFGEELVFKDLNGKIIKKDKQIKRHGFTEGNGFRYDIDRLAEISNSEGIVTGYIGEDNVKDFMSFKHKLYFYNKDKKAIAMGKNDSFITLNLDIYNPSEKLLYEVKSDGGFGKLKITKNDSSSIDFIDAMFYSIIEYSILNDSDDD